MSLDRTDVASVTIKYANKGKHGYLTDLSWDGYSFSKGLNSLVILKNEPFKEGECYQMGLKCVSVEVTQESFYNHNINRQALVNRKGLYSFYCVQCGLHSLKKKTELAALESAGQFFQKRPCERTIYKEIEEVEVK